MSSVESVEKSTNALSKSDLWKLRRACQDFEAILVASLLRTARRTAQSEPTDGVSGLYLDIADTALADAMRCTAALELLNSWSRSLPSSQAGQNPRASDEAAGARVMEDSKHAGQ